MGKTCCFYQFCLIWENSISFCQLRSPYAKIGKPTKDKIPSDIRLRKRPLALPSSASDLCFNRSIKVFSLYNQLYFVWECRICRSSLFWEVQTNIQCWQLYWMSPWNPIICCFSANLFFKTLLQWIQISGWECWRLIWRVR